MEACKANVRLLLTSAALPKRPGMPNASAMVSQVQYRDLLSRALTLQPQVLVVGAAEHR